MAILNLVLLQSEGVLPAFLLIFFLFFIGIVLLVIAAKTIKIVPQASVMLIERLGRFSKVAASGLNILMPFLDKPRAVYWTNTRGGVTSIDLREQYIDLPPQPVITRDNVTIHVDSVVYWQITDPVKAVYEMNDLVGGIVQLTMCLSPAKAASAVTVLPVSRFITASVRLSCASPTFIRPAMSST